MIELTEQQYELMTTHAFQGLPDEACGLLGGRVDGEKKIVERVYLLRNIDRSPEHFSMDPKEQFAAVADIRKKGWVLLGNFHSHPSTPARPSREDIRLAFDPGLSYLILSLMEPGKPRLKGFRIVDGKPEQEILKILRRNRISV